MVSYSVVVAIAVISFSIGVLLGRRGARQGVVASDGAHVVHVVAVPPSEQPAPALASRGASTAQAPQDPELRGYLERGQLIDAIKRYRDLTGVGLREAKDAVEALRRQP
jgi:ribosomal protein L7/L12